MSTRLTMAELARELGVNKATVSRALRGDPLVRESTRIRIQELAAARGYVPDPALSALSQERWRGPGRKTTGNWAVLVADGRDFELQQDFQMLKRYAHERGYELTVIPLSLKGKARLVNRTLKARGIRGVLLHSVTEIAVALDFDWENLDWGKYSWVASRESRYEPPVHLVLHNPFHNCLLALEQMYRKGYRRIVFFREPSAFSRVNVRQQAAALQIAAHHPDCALRHVEAASGKQRISVPAAFRPDAFLFGYPFLHSRLGERAKKIPLGFVGCACAGNEYLRLSERYG